MVFTLQTCCFPPVDPVPVSDRDYHANGEIDRAGLLLLGKYAESDPAVVVYRLLSPFAGLPPGSFVIWKPTEEPQLYGPETAGIQIPDGQTVTVVPLDDCPMHSLASWAQQYDDDVTDTQTCRTDTFG